MEDEEDRHENHVASTENHHDTGSDEEDLFMAPAPQVDEDEDEDDLEVDAPSAAATRLFSTEEHAGLDDDNTYGSPGLRDVFHDEDDDHSKSGTPDPSSSNEASSSASYSRRNKRKNFKPRNIIYDGQEENKESGSTNHENVDAPMNLSGESSARKSLLPRRLENDKEPNPVNASSPMDLSVVAPETNGDDEEAKQPSLSVVRPEILFGRRKSSEDSDPKDEKLSAAPPLPPNLPFPPILAAAALGRPGGSEAMKEAFQEVLKLYGFPQDIAETIAKNAQQTQGKMSLNWRKLL